MPSQVTNYQCPACTGPLRFNAETGKLTCDYCGTSYEVAEIEALYAKKDAEAAKAFEAGGSSDPGGQQTWEPEGMKSYSCPSCGAELVCDGSTAATHCPYCGNPTIVPGQFSSTLRPDAMIPFRLTRDDAIAALKKHYKGKIFLPNSFREQNHIEEIQGVYVPFWLYSGSADADLTFDAERSQTHEEGDWEITTTKHYDVRRAGTIPFENIPVDGSSRMPDDHMDAIEPFDYAELKPFSPAYLPGFLADKYDVSAEDCAARADERAEQSAVGSLSATVTGYDRYTVREQDVKLNRDNVRYALFPVFLLNTKWNGKDFLFAMNGQTGRLIGDLPVSRAKFWSLFAGIAAPLAALVALILYL